MRGLENLGRVRLSTNFFMRDFLHSEIADFYGVANILKIRVSVVRIRPWAPFFSMT
jgi:hypothetical protein